MPWMQSGKERLACVFHEEDEVEWVGGAGFEFGDEVEVERPGVVVFGVNDESTAPNIFAEGDEAGNCVDEKSRSEPVAFVVGVDAESGEWRYGLWVAAGALDDPRWSGLNVELGHAPRVERNDTHIVLGGDDEYFGGARRCRLAGVAAQPVGLFG